MKTILVFLLVLFCSASASAQDKLDQLLTSIDTLPTKSDLAQFENIESRLIKVVEDKTRSNYERARALGFLMHWPEKHRSLLTAQTEPAMVKTALFALARFYPATLSDSELLFMKRHISNSEKSVRWVAVKAIAQLPTATAMPLLSAAVKSPDPAISDWSHRQIDIRKVEK